MIRTSPVPNLSPAAMMSNRTDRASDEPTQDQEDRDREPAMTEVEALIDPKLLSFLMRMDSQSVIGEVAGDPASPRASEESSEELPARIGRYEVESRLGSGTFGVVLRALHPILGQFRALKIPRPATMASASARSRFLSESRMLAQLDHPNIVRVFDAEEAGPLCYIAMECCDGGSLVSWLKSRPPSQPIPEKWAAEMVASIADGVAHAHAHNIYHRDLKPGNILLVHESGQTDPPRFCPKVGDFGMAMLLDRSDGELPTASGTMIGTLAYMAPEQTLGDRSKIGPEADVYALGVILYELLSRHLPFPPHLNRAELLHHVLHVEPTPLSAHRDDLPRDLATICHKCLRKSPADRYRSVAAMAEDLRRFARNEPILGRPLPASRVLRQIVNRQRARISMAVLAASILLLAGGVWAYKRHLDARNWLTRLESASLDAVASLIGEIHGDDPRVADDVQALFETGKPSQKIAAALVIAPHRDDGLAHVVDRLVDASVEELPSLAIAVKKAKIPGIVDRLDQRLKTIDPQEKNGDRRRASAAEAMILLGRPDPAWSLLAFAPDPAARTRIIHDLAKIGVTPRLVVERLKTEPDATVRTALLQAMGEFPDAAWDGEALAKPLDLVASLFRDDPSAGVHGSAKWLLEMWDQHARIVAMESEMASPNPARPGFAWRVSKLGLTLAQVETGDRVIEVADTEVTVDLFLRFLQDVNDHPELGLDFDPRAEFGAVRIMPEPQCPVTGINFHTAATFCWWLTLREGISAADQVYRPREQGGWMVSDNKTGLHGFRLVTDDEFEVAAKAGTNTSRYYGDALEILGRYAWHSPMSGQRTHPVAHLKPNDAGLFDILGNAGELIEWTQLPGKPGFTATFGGGNAMMPAVIININDRSKVLFQDTQPTSSILWLGFRVARTIGPQP